MSFINLLSPSPSPSPLPQPSQGTTSLPAEINLATRQIHSHLNRLITSRLPLCLPPHANSPYIYALGLRSFAAIYFAFETLWRDIPPGADPNLDSRRRQFLENLVPAGLLRSKRLQSDLEALSRITGAPVTLNGRQSRKLQEFLAHIRETVARNPHVLVAYGWVMYMALFSGGRWIRDRLRSAGEEFWNYDDISAIAGAPGFQFLCFDGDADGEDIKADFKGRLARGEALLDTGQRQDIVAEAIEIFRFSIGLVQELDGIAASSDTADEPALGGLQQNGSMRSLDVRWLGKALAAVALFVSLFSWVTMYKAVI